jgi:hypothetical protein
MPSPRAKSIATEGFSVRIKVFNRTPIRNSQLRRYQK